MSNFFYYSENIFIIINMKMLKKILRAAAAGAAFVVVYLVCLYAVQDYLIGTAAEWTRKYGVDAWRLDVPDEVSFRFLEHFKKRLKNGRW